MADRGLTDLELERWLAGDLPEPRLQAATTADRARLEALRTEQAGWLASVDVAAELAAIDRRIAGVAQVSRRTAPRWWTWAISGGALAAAAAAALIFVRGTGTDDDVRFKGDRSISLAIHVAIPGGSRPLASGDTVQPGDRIRFEVHVPKRGYVAIVGVDGSGASTVYYPFGGKTPVPIDPASGGVLQGAVALDATPGDERFYALYAPSSFSIDEPTMARLRAGSGLDEVEATEIVLHKKTAPR